MDEAQKRAWIERQLKKAPPPTWEQWEAANACLGIKVRRRETNAPAQAEDATSWQVTEPDSQSMG